MLFCQLWEAIAIKITVNLELFKLLDEQTSPRTVEDFAGATKLIQCSSISVFLMPFKYLMYATNAMTVMFENIAA
jgi:hypothetical protein